MQDLESAELSYQQATRLNRQNADAWVGRSGVALARRRYNDVVQFAILAMEANPDYNSAFRLDPSGRDLGHDQFDVRHVRLMLAEAYFQLGRYSPADRPDPGNAAAQLRLIRGQFTFRDPGQLLQGISQVALELQQESSGSL
jgi:tetratricopeptide (TPR) repeat protein